jgi:hypothetical protein
VLAAKPDARTSYRPEQHPPGQGDGIADEGGGFARGPERDEADIGAHVVDPVRHQDALGEVAEVVIEDRLRCAAVSSRPIQRAEQLLLFGVDTEHRNPAPTGQTAQRGVIRDQPTGDGQDRNEVLELGKAATAVQCRLEGSLSP